MPDLLTILTATSPIWWKGVKWGAQVLVDAGESILGDEVKKRTKKVLKPVLDKLDTPEAQTAFDEAFKEATEAFLARYGAEERELPKEVVDLLKRGVEKDLDEASRDVLQSYLLTDEPRRAPLDRWVQRQLGGESIVTQEGRIFTQEEVTEALDVFFRELRRAFLGHDFFRTDTFEVSNIQLLTAIRNALLEQRADLEAMQGEYLAYVTRRNEWIELRGIAPRVQGREVKMRMRDLFVPLQASPERDIREERMAELLARVQEALEADEPQDEVLALLEGRPDLEMRELRNLIMHGEPETLMSRLVSIADILANERTVILGDPGTGKSTLLRYAAYAVAQNDASLVGEAALGRIPVVTRIADFARARGKDPTLSLVQYIRDELEEDFAPLFGERLASGGCLILLDGLDEVADPYQRGQVVKEIERLIARYLNNRYVVTSRIVGYEQARLNAQFRHFTLAELPPETIADFVAKWYEAIERESGGELEPGEGRKRARQLSKAIQEHPGIQRLATNPLLLTIIALVNWQGRKLPNRRVELYQIAAETLIENWPLHRQGVHVDAEQVMTILSPVAYHIFATQSGEYISKGDLMPRLVAAIQGEQGGSEKEARETSENILATVSAQSGIFLERGYDEYGAPVYGFLHLTFSEYLTARYLAARWAEDELPLAKFCHVPRWREVILLMVGHIGLSGRPQATRILSDIVELESPYEDSLHRDLLLSGACLADDLRLRPDMSRAIIERLADMWLETHITPLQDRILGLLNALGSTIHQREVERVLGHRLTDQNPEVRSSAAKALGDLSVSAPGTISALCEHLADSHPEVRASVAEALSQLDACDVHMRSQLVDCLGDDDARVRGSAAKALGKMGVSDAHIISQLRELLSDENPHVRGSASNALGKTGTSDPETVAQLGELLGDGNPSVRSEAAEALSQMEWYNPQTLSALRDRLRDDHWRVRYWAACALTEIGASDAQTISALRACLADEDWRMRYIASYSLLKIGTLDQQTMSVLHQCLSDENPHVRYSTVRALAELEASDPNTIYHLRECLNDEIVDVKSNAAGALARIGVSDPESVRALHNRLEDEDWRVRYTMAFALAQIAPSDPHTISSLHDHLAEGYWHIRAAYALAQMAPSDLHAVSSLRNSLADGYWRVRHKVTHILLMIDFPFPPEDVFDLLDRMCDEILRRQSSIAYTLAQVGRSDRSAVSNWRKRLDHTDWRVRDRAAYALAWIDECDPETISALRDRLEDENLDVRCSAAYALGQVGISDPQTIAALVGRLTDAETAFFAARRVCNEAYTSVVALLEQAAEEPPLLEE